MDWCLGDRCLNIQWCGHKVPYWSFLHLVISLLCPRLLPGLFPCHPSLRVWSIPSLSTFFYFCLRRRSPEVSLAFFFFVPFAWKHLSAASFLCGGFIAQISGTVSHLPPLLELTEKLLKTLNAQKLLLSGIRPMTGFFWAGCHQFQIEPEVLIKPSSLDFFFILAGDCQTPAWLSSTNSSIVFHAAVSYHPMVSSCAGWGDLAKRAASFCVAPVGCARREDREGSWCAQPLQMHIKFTYSP